MNVLAMSVLLQISVLSAGPQGYDVARKAAMDGGEPLLVLVGAEWCPACAHMKLDVLPDLQRRGALKSVHYAQVDIDQQRNLAGQLSSASSIPQLILYRKTADGWRRWETIGGQSAEAVEEFLHNGATEQAKQPVAQITQR